MNRQRRILQQRIEIAAIGSGRKQTQERIGGSQRKQQETDADQAEHAQNPRRETLRQCT